MGAQLRLAILLLLSVGVFQTILAVSTPKSINTVTDDIKNNELDSAENDDHDFISPQAPGSNGFKISSSKKNAEKVLPPLFAMTEKTEALADDERSNKLLPEDYKLQNSSKSTNKSDEYYYYDYNDDFDDENYDTYDETITPEPSSKSKSTTAQPSVVESKEKKVSISKSSKVVEAPIENKENKDNKDDKKNKDADNALTDNTNDDDDDDDDDNYDDDDDDDDDDDIPDEEEIIYNENVPCPRYCVCARNINSYLVATCSRFDPGTQKFGSDITDLIVADVGPKYPILLGPEFFLQMGLKHVSSIKISNCTIEYLHPAAFHGLDDLYSVNLTNVGLAIINPDTFANNKKLRLLTISGNDLSVMSSVHYLLKSSTIEELDMSRNNLAELNPNAFSQLSNIVYINLSQNNLQAIPENVFDSVETIEELDLSYNNLKTLPRNIFNRTTLNILHLKYNSITGDLAFGTSDLQQLDLSFNSISQIHHGMFDKMTALTNLNLKGNGITKIQPDSFLTLKDLRHIDLSINELDQVSSMIFYKNSELDVIRLNDNPKLTKLPTDGFQSYNGYFTVYFLDISNCAIGALGHKTFSTMPHLATLKLAWNNINNLEPDTFSSLTKLIDLDLSNNLIMKLDELIFMNNNDLTKLNLSGNTMRSLSVRLFVPLNKLRELDVSDCELNNLFIDNQYGIGRKSKFYETLRLFNASANQIKDVRFTDIMNFKNLRTLDISRNPIKCNEHFQDFISYVSLNKNIAPNQMPTSANMYINAESFDVQTQASWAEFAHEVCKHQEPIKADEKLEERIEVINKELDGDAKKLTGIMDANKLNNIKKILQDETNENEDDASEKIDNEKNNNNNGTEDNNDDDDDENASDYDDDDNDDDDDDEDDDENDDGFNVNKNQEIEQKIIDHGIKVEDIDLKKETNDAFLLNKFLINGDDRPSDNDEEEIIIERGRIYYNGYKFIIPIIIIITSLLVLLMVIAKIISMIMRKRGERYRMALLASHKNSIVYQKLTEDIKPPIKESKQPKVHRYALINQV